MFHDYFLRFESEAQANSVLFTDLESVTFDEAGDESTHRKANYPNIDVIGVIHKPTGKLIESDGIEYPEMAPIAGWHVNVRSTELHPELEAYAVVPAAPVRVWG